MSTQDSSHSLGPTGLPGDGDRLDHIRLAAFAYELEGMAPEQARAALDALPDSEINLLQRHGHGDLVGRLDPERALTVHLAEMERWAPEQAEALRGELAEPRGGDV